MERNNRIYRGILLLTAGLILVGSWVLYYFRLEEPVFFTHYYDLRIESEMENGYNEGFILGYVTNAYDKRVVTAIEFEEIPELKLWASEREDVPFQWESEEKGVPGEIHGRYSVRKVFVRNFTIPEEVKADGKVLRKAKIQFDDSSEITVDIGEVHLYENERRNEVRPYEHVSSSSSSDGTSLTVYRILEELTITDAENPLAERLKGRLNWKIDGEEPDEALGSVYGERSILSVSSRVLTGEDILDIYSLFDFHPVITFTDQEGEVYTQRFYNMRSYDENYSFLGLHRFIKAREEMR